MRLLIHRRRPAQRALAYADYLRKYMCKLKTLDIHIDLGDYADLNYAFEQVPFERIRRITGYLVGTMDHWNSAKAAEEADRVKHAVDALRPAAAFEQP